MINDDLTDNDIFINNEIATLESYCDYVDPPNAYNLDSDSECMQCGKPMKFSSFYHDEFGKELCRECYERWFRNEYGE